MKSRYCLIGRGINYSFSPLLHSEIFSVYSIDATYEIMNLEENHLKEVIEKLRSGEISGINVTIPYKEKIMKYLDELTPEASEIGAVNTVSKRDGKLIGHNTDYYGFKGTLERMKLSCRGKTAVVLGTGGAAKACVKVLKDLGAKIILVSRNPQESKSIFPELEIISYEDLESISGYLIVNSTPVGTSPNIEDSPVSQRVVENFDFAIDLIYNPKITKFLSFSRHCSNGFYMLVAQGVKAEEIWQNIPMDAHKIYDLLENKIY